MTSSKLIRKSAHDVGLVAIANNLEGLETYMNSNKTEAKMTTTTNTARTWMDLSAQSGLNRKVREKVHKAYANGQQTVQISQDWLTGFDRMLLRSWGFELNDNGDVVEVEL